MNYDLFNSALEIWLAAVNSSGYMECSSPIAMV